VRGSDAGGRFGPDLTHVASRATLAAGTMPNTTGHLGGWLVDAQRIKPGVNMPAMALTPDELNGLLAYLGGLR
jgi:cytochrome c oxidase subunit 2